jgi:TRAP-type C4-dicarboxylate transport system permease small subunit
MQKMSAADPGGNRAAGIFAVVAAVLRWSLIVAVATMLVAITLQVIGRYVFLRAPSWSEELAVFAFSWATIGGLALGVREGFHVALTLLIEQLPPALRMIWARVVSLATAGLGIFLLWSGVRFLDFTSGSFSAAMEYPIELLNVMAPIAGGLIALFAVERLIWPLAAAPNDPETPV